MTNNYAQNDSITSADPDICNKLLNRRLYMFCYNSNYSKSYYRNGKMMKIVSTETSTFIHTKKVTLGVFASDLPDDSASYISYHNAGGTKSIHSVNKGVLRSICYTNSKKVSLNDANETHWFLQEKPTLSFNVQLNS